MDEGLIHRRYSNLWQTFLNERRQRKIESYPWRDSCQAAARACHYTDPVAIQQWAEWAQYVATARATGEI